MAYDNRARTNWHRYMHLRDRGHLDYMATAARNEAMYLGGGEQWSREDRARMREQRRPAYEFNQIMPSVDAALGHQIQHRLDISFKPRGGQSDLIKATVLSKVVMQIADMNNLHWKETQVYGDGLIEQRGYYDVRMDFTNNVFGEVRIEVLDPRDVVPDDAGKSYDPDDWGDVTVTRWFSLDDIEQRYGLQARMKAAASGDDGPDWGTMDEEEERNKFGTERMYGAHDAYMGEGTSGSRYRVIDRQYWVYEKTKCLAWPMTGETVVMANLRPEDVQAAIANDGAVEVEVMKRRVRWDVSTYCATLFEGYSPYEHFTVVPFFAHFRRGKTRGMVDNAIGPQEALNKAVSQYVHIINSTANSGWIVEENSLTNMDTEELEERGAMTGLVLEYEKGTQAPKKIDSNTIPSGVDKFIDRATQQVKDVTVPDAMRGLQGSAVSGVAKQADQFASQQQMAVPLDNLAYTRNMLAGRILRLVQRYYDSYRVFKITETDFASGQMTEKTLEINRPEVGGGYWNDITIGTYDVVITEQAMGVTFENTQFTQAMEMKKAGVAIPDAVIIKYSSLADREEIVRSMSASDPLHDAQAELTRAQAMLTQANATKVNVESIYTSVTTAQLIALNPAVSPLADSVLGSSGFKDHDMAPLVPEAPAGLPALPPPTNTDPMTSANPGVGAQAGIETGLPA